MVIARSAVRVGEVLALVAQRVDAPLLIDVQSAGIEDRQGRLRGYELVGLVEQPVARLEYRPERREVDEQLRHQRFVEYGAVNAVHSSGEKR